jgi:hypothetical protein
MIFFVSGFLRIKDVAVKKSVFSHLFINEESDRAGTRSVVKERTDMGQAGLCGTILIRSSRKRSGATEFVLTGAKTDYGAFRLGNEPITRHARQNSFITCLAQFR